MKHGILSGYSHFKCRCDDCRSVWRDYQRQYYKANRAAILENGRHRSEVNQEAIRERKRNYYQATREVRLERSREYGAALRERRAARAKSLNEASRAHATRQGCAWSSAEDRIVLDESFSVREAAFATGRSIRAIAGRRRKLRKLSLTQGD